MSFNYFQNTFPSPQPPSRRDRPSHVVHLDPAVLPPSQLSPYTIPFPPPPYYSPTNPGSAPVQAASTVMPPPCELSLRSFPFPPPQYSSPLNCYSVEVYPSSPSGTIPLTSLLSLFPRSEQTPSSRFRPIALRPPLTTSTPTPLSPPAPICHSIGPVSANFSIISHSVSIQPTLPLYTLPHSVVGSSTVEPYKAGRHNRRTHQYFREPAISIFSTERPAALNRIPQSRQSTIENQSNPRRIVDQAL